jgi:hypothetical protein
LANAEQKWDFGRTEIGSCRTEPVEQKSDHRSETGNTGPNVPVNYNVLILMNIPNLAVKHSLNAKDSTGSKDSCGHDEGIQLELGASLINAQI